MLQVFFGIYLVLGLPAILLLWATLAASKRHQTEERHNRERSHRTGLAISNSKLAR